MRKVIGVLSALTLAVVPLATAAHERQQFEINGEVHEFVIGSLNEPIVVDDKTGLELSVREIHGEAEEEDHHSTAGAIEGLEETLKVEMIAGGMKKTTDISPVFGVPGSYKNTFYPTVATTFSYRLFGTIDETPFDYTFTCNPAGHAPAAEDKNRVEVSEGVVRVLKTGSFSCPMEKADLGFPESSSDVVSLKEDASSGTMVGWVAGAIALAALALALRRRS